MSNLYAKIAGTPTPQSEPIPGREAAMAPNNAGGYAFTIDKWAQLDRFLILGSEGGTYYASERKLTLDNASNVLACIAEDGPRVVLRIVQLDADNRAPKMQPLLFALALCHTRGDANTKRAAGVALPMLLRTGTHLFTYLSNLKALGSKLGRSKRTALTGVLNGMTPDMLAYQMMKYANREGWTWRDAVRVIHPKPADPAHNALFAHASGKVFAPEVMHAHLPPLIEAVTAAKSGAITDRELVQLILTYNLTWEMVPSERQTPAILEVLASRMPATALLRQLARLTAAGILKPFSGLGYEIAARIADDEWLRVSRIHPIQILSALTVYKRGTGVRGSLTWTPNPSIVSALETAFYASFAHVQPTNKNIMLAIDVSGSMGWSEIAGVPGLTPAVASACLAMVAARTEPRTWICAFSVESHGYYNHTGVLRDLNITATESLESAMLKTSRMTAGGTDCAFPALHATKEGLGVDAFVIFTDNETWAGDVHPSVALNNYRKQSGIAARQIVVGMTATGFSIADPADPLSLDMVGFDSAAPQILAGFIRG